VFLVRRDMKLPTIAFAGAKMLAVPWIAISSVAVIALVIGAAAALSLVVARRECRRARTG